MARYGLDHARTLPSRRAEPRSAQCSASSAAPPRWLLVHLIGLVDHGRLVGIVTRTDILGVRRRGLDHDRPQAGSASRLVSQMRRRSG